MRSPGARTTGFWATPTPSGTARSTGPWPTGATSTTCSPRSTAFCCEAGRAGADPRRVRRAPPAGRRRGRRRHDEALARAPAVLARPGLTAIAGGKYTTYRVMARDAVDAAARTSASAAPSATERLPLLGAGDPAGGARPRSGSGTAAARTRCASSPRPTRRWRPRSPAPARLPRGRGGARGHAPGRARPRRHPLAAHARLDRGPRPRPGGGGGHRAAGRAGTGVVGGPRRGGARPLP